MRACLQSSRLFHVTSDWRVRSDTRFVAPDTILSHSSWILSNSYFSCDVPYGVCIFEEGSDKGYIYNFQSSTDKSELKFTHYIDTSPDFGCNHIYVGMPFIIRRQNDTSVLVMRYFNNRLIGHSHWWVYRAVNFLDWIRRHSVLDELKVAIHSFLPTREFCNVGL